MGADLGPLAKLLLCSISLLFFSGFGFSATAKLHSQEVAALKEIGKKLGKSDWDFRKDPCSGEGNWTVLDERKGFESSVICDCSDNTSCHVVSISLKAQNLSGTVPHEFSKLQYLKELDLSRNVLRGSIPSQRRFRQTNKTPLSPISKIVSAFCFAYINQSASYLQISLLIFVLSNQFSLSYCRSRHRAIQNRNLPEMMASSSSEDQPQLMMQLQQEQDHQQKSPVREKECVHRAKAIQFLGRTTPIVLQNDNGPCPLLAICNVVLLRNNLHLSPDIAEVSQEKLLSLVAERLIDSNSNISNKDAGYVENQQQNISDAIDLLPRLTTGIDVNIKFKRIDDFEFTPECAIFDLLDIPLYHGWIVDPQDEVTANAIGSKSYNAITSELVALETRNMEGKCKSNPEEDCVDFAAATTAALGVPSPCLSKARSFDDSPHAVTGSPPGGVSYHQAMRKGDLEEEAELLRAMRLSEIESPTAETDSVIISSNSDESKVMPVDSGITLFVQHQSYPQSEAYVPNDRNASNSDNVGLMAFKTTTGEASSSEIAVPIISSDAVEKSKVETQQQSESSASLSLGKDTAPVDTNHSDIPGGLENNSESIIAPDANESAAHQNGYITTEQSSLSAPDANSGSSSGRMLHVGAPEVLTPNVDSDEPIYEGEECILESIPTANENPEPMYEGEVVLAEQSDKNIVNSCDVNMKDEITPQQGELIRNFLKNNASQLTFYGLFGLQDGLKERELCVFFRNNHFSTMFKYEGELYLLATDQGYINEPDLVWEKLNEVNGDTIFMTSNFKEFKVENHATETWDENNVRASTADYLASIDSASQPGQDMNSDLQLAIALQQQEFEQQPQRQNVQQPSATGGSRMVTGPQVPRTANRLPAPTRPEPKSKDKCTVM